MNEDSRSESPVQDRDPNETRQIVRDRYASIATDETCCGNSDTGSEQIGYDADELAAVADGADLGLGCGNPKALANLTVGERVVDLGSGAGFDCFLAASEVGPDGDVIGVDMTPEMISKARRNIDRNDVSNVEFRLGEIEHLPVADESVDVVISNCVVNLSPEKRQVVREAFRVLRPGGRIAISDVVLTAEVPATVRSDPESVAACVAGASSIERLEHLLAESGFEQISISPNDESEEFIREWDDRHDVSEFLVSAHITGRKPTEN